ncbi:hypothetical protein HBH99_204130 [Parastagonospora nodorum]|nr:hypothetical protein HBI05_236290 [Parastagonospora nodorum]KAH4355626.1 hypothetical protein HBH97_236400 [Parastagonospora nodorum]KAH4378216.1 hypothetical protein HBH99_204130 [Parastagonospora nodorum]KAH4915763.1 hypothetical protein HBH73_238310 [Parastagonospora nodorum]KAH5706200.1 hypothetical protein HBI20_222900 [Parastagonospora nodorum]
MKRMSRQLERIVIDECHVLMDSSEPWRPDVLKLTEMTDKDTGGLHDYDLTTHTPAPPKIVETPPYTPIGLDLRDSLRGSR